MFSHLRQIFSVAPLVSHPFNGPTLPTAIAAAKAASSLPPTMTETAVFASGCFWGTEHIFRKYYDGKGLKDAKVGYIGGDSKNPSYRQVCSGTSGHAEAVKLTFAPAEVTYAELVEFFYRTHSADQLNQQGNDRGTQYRSGIFYNSDEQKKTAEQVTAEVLEKHYKPQGKSIATAIVEATEWYDAEDYHQKYLHNNPDGYQCPTHRLHW